MRNPEDYEPPTFGCLELAFALFVGTLIGAVLVILIR